MSTDERVNPYESPLQAERLMPSARVQGSRSLGSAALALLLLSGTQLVCTLLLLTLVVIAAVFESAEIPFDSFVAMLGSGFLLQSFVQAAILRAAICMRQSRYLSFCRTMAIVSSIPLLTPWFNLGIPFGIWATILLFQKDVAAEFDVPGPKEPIHHQ
ncbi:hypothetical protein NA78x_002323 [Anatilimnocola sp. NA78]|uniref:hypothetical protein n=1 Tax=Anatilimnocola sp. NA78 TaxID=3415683 RepID=UPI003CE48695